MIVNILVTIEAKSTDGAIDLIERALVALHEKTHETICADMWEHVPSHKLPIRLTKDNKERYYDVTEKKKKQVKDEPKIISDGSKSCSEMVGVRTSSESEDKTG